MSASLLRKGLELLETTGVSSSQPKGAATTAQSNKQLLKRKKKKKLFSQSKRETSTVKGKITKSALEEYRKCQAIDHFQENMLYMMRNQFVAESTITQKILAQNRGRKAIDNPQEKAKKKPESTVFTEEDFKKFEREYFGGAGTS